jgi:hypothetical protein
MKRTTKIFLIVFSLLSAFFPVFSTQAHAEDLESLLTRLRAGEPAIVGNGIEISENVILTVAHVIGDSEIKKSKLDCCFESGKTIDGNGNSINWKFVEMEEVDEPELKFRSVLLLRTSMDIYVIRRNGSNYFSEKVVKKLEYDNEPAENDPVRILLLSENVSSLNELSDSFGFPSNSAVIAAKPVNIRFSARTSDTSPMQLKPFVWKSIEQDILFLDAGDFCVSKLYVGNGMSGGGVFFKNRLVGLLRAKVQGSINLTLSDASTETVNEFKKHSWDIQGENGIYKISTDAMTIIKKIEFNKIVQALSDIPK